MNAKQALDKTNLPKVISTRGRARKPEANTHSFQERCYFIALGPVAGADRTMAA